MALDVNTLFFLTMYVEAILGLLLLLSWVQNTHTHAMAWWGGAHLLRSLSVALYGMYGTFPNVISIDLAGALLFTSYGVTWTGARVFEGRAPQPVALAAGAAAWILASQFAGVTDNSDIRNLLSAAIIAGFSWAAAYELWYGRAERLVSRWPAVLLLFAHGALFLLREPLTTLLPQVGPRGELSTAWLTVLSPEALLFTISIAFVLLAMGKERAELGHKTAALVDALTGLANRRAFTQDAELIVRHQVLRGRPVAVFLVDLDHFKSVNDRYGHAAGDSVLRMFADVCTNKLRSSDLVGRLGGEEFAILLGDATRDNAFLVAERIRVAFEAASVTVEGQTISATISIGVAIIQDSTQNLSMLLGQADQALYRAKARGRNRVELAPVGLAELSDSAKAHVAERAGVKLSA
jgi:diguanylate cyclase (GGDEF)-like protein